MTREEFQRLCRERIVFLDGATGTNLQKAGMPTGVCPEAWILEHPDTMMQLQKAYFEAVISCWLRLLQPTESNWMSTGW